MKKLILLFLLLLIGESAAQSTFVQQIINSVNQDSLIFFVRELSGDTSTIINGTPQTIQSRNKNQPGNALAETYLKQKLQGYGLTTTVQSFSTTGKNVYAVQPGNLYPNQKFIICAHFDDMPSGSIAPGADDNASGTAAVIEAARIFSQFSFPWTIVYSLWDEEEQGLIGSNYYASQASINNDTILAVINLDMIAWDSNNDKVAEIHTNNQSASLAIKDKMIYVNSTYNIGITLNVINPGTNASDHSSFWQKGYGAVLLIENYYGNDFNQYYHTTSDLLQYFNQPYFVMLTKLSLGTLAEFVGIGLTSIEDTLIVSDYKLEQNYPNPFNPSTRIKYQVSNISLVILKVYDVLGNEVATLVNEEKAPGSYNVQFTMNNLQLSSGIYFYQLKASDFVQTKKMAIIK
jgi:hypothetical protein